MPFLQTLGGGSARGFGRGVGGGGMMVEIKLWGAGGGASQDCSGNYPGRGAGGGYVYVECDGTISSGDTLYILVGQNGSANSGSNTYGGGARHGGGGGGSGGGGTFVSLNSGSMNTGNIIAAAGGGSGGSTGGNQGNSGSGGGLTGAGGSGGSTGGGQSSGGTAGTGGFGGGGSAGSPGSFMQGGYGMSCKGSGGGGGWYGGGGGNGDCGACSSGAGGGGSSYVGHPYVTNVLYNAQAWGYNMSPEGQADPDWANNAGHNTGSGGSAGRAVIIVDGTKHIYNYTGNLQTLTL